MNPLSPYNVMKRVAEAVPEERKRNIIIVGSLASGFHFFKKDRNRIVRTKDIDCLLSPREEALRKCYSGEWRNLARAAGQGLRQLIESKDDLDEALHSCNAGLLASRPVSPEQFRAAAERLIEDAIVPLASRAES